MRFILVSLIVTCALSSTFANPLDAKLVGPRIPVVTKPVVVESSVPPKKPTLPVIPESVQHQYPTFVSIDDKPTSIPSKEKPVLSDLNINIDVPATIGGVVFGDELSTVPHVPVKVEETVVPSIPVVSEEEESPLLSIIPVEEIKVPADKPTLLESEKPLAKPVLVPIEKPIGSIVADEKPVLPVVSVPLEKPVVPPVEPLISSEIPVSIVPASLASKKPLVAPVPVPVEKPLDVEKPLVDVEPPILPIPVKPESTLVLSVPSLPTEKPVVIPVSTVLAEKPLSLVVPKPLEDTLIPEKPVAVVAPVVSKKPLVPVVEPLKEPELASPKPVVPSTPLTPVLVEKPVLPVALGKEPLPKPAVVEPVPKPTLVDEDSMEVTLVAAESKSFPTAVVAAPETEPEQQTSLSPEDPFLITPEYEEIEPFPEIPGVPPFPDPNAIPATAEGRLAAKPGPQVPIIKSYNIPIPGGTFWGYTGADGTQRQEKIVSRPVTLPDGTQDESLVVQGRYQYLGDDGLLYYFWYLADEFGNRMINPPAEKKL
jgi:hypothetical protein